MVQTLINEIIKKPYFIIRQEFYKEDFEIYYNFLIKKYNIKSPNIEYFTENPRNNTSKYNDEKKLSKLEIENLKSKLKDDYFILNELLNHNLISKEYLSSFI